jgi:hypothetical protein
MFSHYSDLRGRCRPTAAYDLEHFKQDVSPTLQVQEKDSMSVVTDFIAAERKTVVQELPHADRIFGRRWTPEQLYVLAAKDQEVQRHVEYRTARIALSCQDHTANAARIRSMVVEAMGGVCGTYWMFTALQMAQLALANPQLLTRAQYNLLVAPLEAAEAVAARTDEAIAA